MTDTATLAAGLYGSTESAAPAPSVPRGASAAETLYPSAVGNRAAPSFLTSPRSAAEALYPDNPSDDTSEAETTLSAAENAPGGDLYDDGWTLDDAAYSEMPSEGNELLGLDYRAAPDGWTPADVDNFGSVARALSMGPSTLEAIVKAGAASIATGRYANKEDLVRGLGAGAQGKMRAALGLIERAEAKYPGVSSWLAEMGALHQPAVIERLAARAAGLKRKGL